MSVIILVLGSNLGNKKSNLINAKILLKRAFGYKNFLASASNIESRALVKPNSPEVFSRLNYINSAIAFNIILPSLVVFKKIKKIEKKIGRRGKEKWAPRKIDIDVLIYEGNETNLPHLKIPHPELLNREFAINPVKEIYAKLNKII
jgi:2-amino-4-hydroxy-6-hydroxymethyldihydropteridine diphosphokinase